MSLLSKIMKPIRKGLAPTSRRNMGGLEPRVPMPPRRKGGLPGLMRSIRDEIRERPRSIGGIGGGIPAIKEPSPMAPPLQKPIARPILRRRPPQLPPKRGPIMSIGGPGGGITDDRAISPLERPNFIGRSKEQIDEIIAKAREQAERTVQPPAAPIIPLPVEKIDPPKILPPLPPERIPLQDFGFGPGIRPTEIREPDGSIIAGPAGITPPQQRPMIAELPPERIAEIGDPIPATDPVTPTVDPVTTAPTPSATTEQGTDPIQSMPAPVGALDPVLLGQKTTENLSDPLTRALYFGTQDQPGFYQQLQQAGANLIGQDVPLQQTAGLTPLELLARQQAVAGLGGFEPFFQQNKDLIDQAIGQSRRAEALRDPYFSRAERQMQIGLGDELSGIGEARGITTGATDRFGGSLGRLGRQAIGSTVDYGGRLGESEDLIRGTLGGYDQGMTQQFYNPFEDRVVQQTIDDVLEAGDKQDIAARAREISSGAFGGSRARLGAMERREALGEGLAKALGNIRQQGFSEAQRTGLSEFARQREAERAASRGLSGLAGSRLGAQQQLGTTLRGLTGDQFGAQQQLAANLMGYGAAGAGARQNLATGLLGIGQQRGSGASALGQQLAGYGSQIGDVGSVLDTLRRGQRSELTGYGATGRGIAETGLSRIFQQQMGQQQRPLGVLGQIGSMLPGYQQTSTRIDSQYGLPTDPSAAGLGAAFSAYGSLAPRQGQS